MYNTCIYFSALREPDLACSSCSRPAQWQSSNMWVKLQRPKLTAKVLPTKLLLLDHKHIFKCWILLSERPLKLPHEWSSDRSVCDSCEDNVPKLCCHPNFIKWRNHASMMKEENAKTKFLLWEIRETVLCRAFLQLMAGASLPWLSSDLVSSAGRGCFDLQQILKRNTISVSLQGGSRTAEISVKKMTFWRKGEGSLELQSGRVERVDWERKMSSHWVPFFNFQQIQEN